MVNTKYRTYLTILVADEQEPPHEILPIHTASSIGVEEFCYRCRLRGAEVYVERHLELFLELAGNKTTAL